jgi:hypothetical protein
MTMTYDSLVSQLQLIFERNDDPFNSLIPNFIDQAHQRIARDAISLEMVLYVKSNLVIGNNLLSKPTNWRRPLSLKIIIPGPINQYQVVEWRSYEFCRSYFPSDSVISGQSGNPPTFSPLPLFYCDYGREYLLLSPTPALSYPFELSFYGILPTITSSLQTNFLTVYAPTVLLYACLLETSTFLKVDERIPVWQGAYKAALDELNQVDRLAKEDRQTNRERD